MYIALTRWRRTKFPLYRNGNSKCARLRKQDIRVGTDIECFKKDELEFVTPVQGYGMSTSSQPLFGRNVWMLPKDVQFPKELTLLDDTKQVPYHYLISPSYLMRFDDFVQALEVFGKSPPWVKVESKDIDDKDPQVPPNANPAHLVRAALFRLRYLKKELISTDDEDTRAVLEVEANLLQRILESWPQGVTNPVDSGILQASVFPYPRHAKKRISLVIGKAAQAYLSHLHRQINTTESEDVRADLEMEYNFLLRIMADPIPYIH